jgi:hypothetical protein
MDHGAGAGLVAGYDTMEATRTFRIDNKRSPFMTGYSTFAYLDGKCRPFFTHRKWY